MDVGTARELDRRATAAAQAVIATISPDDLTRRTPCDEWNLGDLLQHMTAVNNGFTAAARGAGADLDAWLPPQIEPEQFVAANEESARLVAHAFDEAARAGHGMVVPAADPHRALPTSDAIGAHFFETVAHSWDVARAMDVEYVVDDEVIDGALQIAAGLPGGEWRIGPEALFAPVLSVGEDTDALHRLLGLLGRDPAWRP